MLAWRAILTAFILFAAACTVTLVIRIVRNAVRTRSVFFADKEYDFVQHPAVACAVAVFWLSLTALMTFAVVAVVADLPALIQSIFRK